MGAVGACGGVLYGGYLSSKDTQLRVAVAKHEESTRAHRWVIGYGALRVTVRIAFVLLWLQLRFVRRLGPTSLPLPMDCSDIIVTVRCVNSMP